MAKRKSDAKLITAIEPGEFFPQGMISLRVRVNLNHGEYEYCIDRPENADSFSSDFDYIFDRAKEVVRHTIIEDMKQSNSKKGKQ